MSHDESLIITNITSAPARRKVQNIFEEQIPDAGESLLRKKNYEDAKSVLLQCTISGEIVGGLLALHPSTQMDGELKRQTGMNVKDDFPDSLGSRTIVEVAVLPQYQHRGIGRRLVEEAEEAFETTGATLSLAFVDERSPENTHQFWKKMGYTAGNKNRRMEAPTGLPVEAAVHSFVHSTRAGTMYYRQLNTPRKVHLPEVAPELEEVASTEVAENPRSVRYQWRSLVLLLMGIAAAISLLLWII